MLLKRFLPSDPRIGGVRKENVASSMLSQIYLRISIRWPWIYLNVTCLQISLSWRAQFGGTITARSSSSLKWITLYTLSQNQTVQISAMFLCSIHPSNSLTTLRLWFPFLTFGFYANKFHRYLHDGYFRLILNPLVHHLFFWNFLFGATIFKLLLRRSSALSLLRLTFARKISLICQVIPMIGALAQIGVWRPNQFLRLKKFQRSKKRKLVTSVIKKAKKNLTSILHCTFRFRRFFYPLVHLFTPRFIIGTL